MRYNECGHMHNNAITEINLNPRSILGLGVSTLNVKKCANMHAFISLL
jgi:hypothetical protein